MHQPDVSQRVEALPVELFQKRRILDRVDYGFPFRFKRAELSEAVALVDVSVSAGGFKPHLQPPPIVAGRERFEQDSQLALLINEGNEIHLAMGQAARFPSNVSFFAPHQGCDLTPRITRRPSRD